MKTVTDINQQINNLQSALAELDLMNSRVQSVMLLGNKPVIRIVKNGHCIRLFEQGKARYTHIGHNRTGRFRQGGFELHGCWVIWSESLH